MALDTSILMLVIFAIVGLFTSIGAAIAAWYYVTRIHVEKQRSIGMKEYYETQLAIMREQLQRTEVYYDKRIEFSKEQVEVEKAKLEVEKAKLEVDRAKSATRRNGPIGKL